MRVIVKPDLIVLAPAGGDEDGDLAALRALDGQVFRLEDQGGGVMLARLGPEADACNHPINITSQSPPPYDALSNFAATPFTLDDRAYASIEGFWQSLKAGGEAERSRIAALSGADAKRAGSAWPDAIVYEGETIRTGTAAHWRLMTRAVRAKFDQNDAARAALLATGERPLTHRVRRDSETIPGVVMSDIWMAVRRTLREPRS